MSLGNPFKNSLFFCKSFVGKLSIKINDLIILSLNHFNFNNWFIFNLLCTSFAKVFSKISFSSFVKFEKVDWIFDEISL